MGAFDGNYECEGQMDISDFISHDSKEKIQQIVKSEPMQNCIKCGDSLELLNTIPDNCIDLIVTSPPYDNLRTYDGYTWNFHGIANELYRVLKIGGCAVWIISDATIKGSESGSSFEQALYFKSIGFNIHDTMIWQKDTLLFPDKTRYGNCFEYMFIFSKGRPKIINKICDRKNKWCGSKVHGTNRNAAGETFRKSNHNKTTISEYGARFNIWNIPTEKHNTTGHPAVFPKQLAIDHILSWSNEGDIVLDPFIGSGTTALACIDTKRNYIGFDINPKYCEIAKKRIDTYKS